jgi:glycosyltransferase involved in cell wall biosynthesis
MKPLVTVVCAWYNRADYITDTLNSLSAQDFESFEIIVINDGSKDERVRKILDDYRDIKLTVIHQENTGFVRAIKKAINISKGEFIAIQGAGDISLPTRLREQAAVLSYDNEIGIVGSKRREVIIGGPADGESVIGGGDILYPNIKNILFGNNPFSHGEVMFRRDLYDKVGGYREFFKFAQDRDLWIRMAPFCKMHVIDKVLYERRAFKEDGIAFSHEKIAIQQAYSSFARQCHFDRKKYGVDYIDIYGMHGGLFRSPQRSYANALAKIAVQSFYFDNPEAGLLYATRAVNEKRTIFSIGMYIVARFIYSLKFVQPIYKWMLGFHPNAKVWPRQ